MIRNTRRQYAEPNSMFYSKEICCSYWYGRHKVQTFTPLLSWMELNRRIAKMYATLAADLWYNITRTVLEKNSK